MTPTPTPTPPESEQRQRRRREGFFRPRLLLPITQTQPAPDGVRPHPSPRSRKVSRAQQLFLSNIISFFLGVTTCGTVYWMGSTNIQTQETAVEHNMVNNNNNYNYQRGARHHSLVNGVVAKHVNFDWKTAIESGPITSLDGTTGVGVPGKIREWLLKSGASIEEDAQDHYGSELAVKEVEENMCNGWDFETSNFGNVDCTSSLDFGSYEEKRSLLPDPSEIDIVTPSIRNLDFLNEWREFFQGYHIIIIQDGDQGVSLDIPHWVDYELHKRADIKRALGENHWIISQKDASIRNYGFLLSKKRYIFTIDDDCRPAYDNRGHKINPLAFHYRNLKTPSTPYMLNTLYDPYQDGSDFVRGYPYSLRSGVPTGVSHGIWMNQPDYDAPTQLLKVRERVSRIHEMVLTVPAGIFFPLCSMNLAFDRTLIGPAMMQGLMGEGMPWARYDDMFSGWASKSVADHLGIGIKSGMPYIRHDKASNPFVNLKKEYKGLWWQEIVLRFFMTEVKYSTQADTPSKAYKELAGQIRVTLTSTHQYFDKLATAMELWTDFWDRAENGDLKFLPSRQNKTALDPINQGYYSKDTYFAEMGKNLNLVGHDDIARKERSSAKLKVFVYELEHEFTLEKYIEDINSHSQPRSNCDWNMNVCAEENWVGQYSSMRQYGADATLIKLFRSYVNRVYDPADADIFVVPFPHSSICRTYFRQCWGKCSCSRDGGREKKRVEKMIKSLKYLNDDTKKFHLFLLTGDTENHVDALTSMPLYVSLGGQDFKGSTNIVIPPANTEPGYQPSALAKFDWTRPRKTAVFMNFGVVNDVRRDAFSVLEKTPFIAGLPVEVHEIIEHRHFVLSAQETWQKYRDSYFCPILQGDLPYQKRFYDVVAAGCIPVVVASASRDNNPHKSWFKQGSLGYNVTYPFAYSNFTHTIEDKQRLGLVDYSEFVVEVDSVHSIVPVIESLLKNDAEAILGMQTAIGKVAKKFVYGLGDDMFTPGDAFDTMLIQLEEYHSLHRSKGGQDFHFQQEGRGGAETKSETSNIKNQETTYCGNRKWNGTDMSCNRRVSYLADHYHMAIPMAIQAVLKENCTCV